MIDPALLGRGSIACEPTPYQRLDTACGITARLRLPHAGIRQRCNSAARLPFALTNSSQLPHTAQGRLIARSCGTVDGF